MDFVASPHSLLLIDAISASRLIRFIRGIPCVLSRGTDSHTIYPGVRLDYNLVSNSYNVRMDWRCN